MVTRRKPAKADFVVFADIYNDAQVAVFRDIAELDRWLAALGMERISGKATNATAMCVTDPKGLDWFLAYIPRDCSTVTVCHECLHLAWYILDSYGVKVSCRNHEALAYLQQHLAKQILAHR